MTRIVHLVDDIAAGGVMRLLRTIETCPTLAAQADHDVVPVRRGFLAPPRLTASIIVSHLSVSWRTLPGLMALRAACPGATLIHVEHSYSRGFAAHRVTAPARFRTLLRTAYALFDRVVAVSAEQGRWMTERGLVDPAALAVIPPAVRTDAFASLPDAPARPRVIGAIGRFDAQKGFDILIRAFRRIGDPTLELRLVGDGPERARLVALAGGDRRIRFPGFAEDPAAALGSVDAVVVPSRWEPYGLVALEARAAGRPVMVADVDGLRDQAAEGAVAVRGHGTDVWRDALSDLVAGRTRPDLPRARHRALGAWDRFADAFGTLCAEAAAGGGAAEPKAQAA